MRTLMMLVVFGAGCTSWQHRDRTLESTCLFAVANQTPYAMTVRLALHETRSEEIGALNPGELLHHQVPCAQGTVYIYGIAIPSQVGAATPLGYVRRWANLSETERVLIPLSWP